MTKQCEVPRYTPYVSQLIKLLLMDQVTFIKKVAIWVAAIAATLIAIIGLSFGKVIEGSLFAEIAKWVVMGLVIIGILEGFIYMGVGGILYHFVYEKKRKNNEGSNG